MGLSPSVSLFGSSRALYHATSVILSHSDVSFQVRSRDPSQQP